MGKIFYFVLILLQLTLVSCGDSPKQLFETAEFEMLQTNYSHATKLYQELIDKHPSSDFVEQSRQRLEEIRVKQLK